MSVNVPWSIRRTFWHDYSSGSRVGNYDLDSKPNDPTIPISQYIDGHIGDLDLFNSNIHEFSYYEGSVLPVKYNYKNGEAEFEFSIILGLYETTERWYIEHSCYFYPKGSLSYVQNVNTNMAYVINNTGVSASNITINYPYMLISEYDYKFAECVVCLDPPNKTPIAIYTSQDLIDNYSQYNHILSLFILSNYSKKFIHTYYEYTTNNQVYNHIKEVFTKYCELLSSDSSLIAAYVSRTGLNVGNVLLLTKTYTNSTWSASKTWYIKTTFRYTSNWNVVNYVTMIRKRNRQLRLSGFVFYFCLYSYIISIRLRYFLLYKEVR